jgi:hypothetical protein
MAKALKSLEEISADEETRALADMREIAELSYRSEINGAYDDGIEKGIN